MKIQTKDSNGEARYYVAVNNGKVILGSRGRAAELDERIAEQVARHLRQLDKRFAEHLDLVP